MSESNRIVGLQLLAEIREQAVDRPVVDLDLVIAEDLEEDADIAYARPRRQRVREHLLDAVVELAQLLARQLALEAIDPEVALADAPPDLDRACDVVVRSH